MPHLERTASDNSDFPYTLSWSEERKSRTSYTQHVPNDVLRFDELDIIIPVATFLDRTTLDVDFDHSCLGGLEDELLHSPIDAFEAICWASATYAEVEPLSRYSPGKLHAMKQNGTGEVASSDESESDTDECRTFNDDVDGFPAQNPEDNRTKPLLIDTKNHLNLTSFDANQQIFAFEQRFLNFSPADSIGLSPVPPHLNGKAKTTRLTALRTRLPLRRKNPTLAT